MPVNALAQNAEVMNALAPESSNSNPYIDSLMRKAHEEYPFIKQHNPIVVVGHTGEDYAETWPKDEPGPPGPNGESTRPVEFGKAGPNGRVGIMIGRPNDFTHHDLAGEVMHVDPLANQTRDNLIKTLSVDQIKALNEHSLDFGQTLNEGRDVKAAIKNATDAAMRGYILGQWPEETNAAMNYQPMQKALLEQLKTYVKTGKKP